MLPHLRALRERIHAEVCERGFNPRVGAFTQSYGSDALDASVLLIPHVGFLPGTDPRVQGTVAAIEKTLLQRRLRAPLRHRTRHRRPARHRGRVPRLQLLAGRQLRLRGPPATRPRRCSSGCSALRNHLGLLAEEYDPELQRQIGNFPQAFSHLALIMTAQIIESVSQKREWTRPAVTVHAPAP